MENDISCCLEDADNTGAPLSVSIATGVDAAPYVSEQAERLKSVFLNLETQVFAIKNDYFGHTITVAGLVTATDIINQLKGKQLGEYLILPDVMLRHETDRFLDDLTVSDIEKALGITVLVCKADGQGLFETIESLFKEG